MDTQSKYVERADGPPKKVGVFMAIESLDGSVAVTNKLIEGLADRLSGLLRGSYPAAEMAGEAQPERDKSSATSEVEGIDKRVRRLNDRLEELLARLDV
jgi:hypothetical protein